MNETINDNNNMIDNYNNTKVTRKKMGQNGQNYKQNNK